MTFVSLFFVLVCVDKYKGQMYNNQNYFMFEGEKRCLGYTHAIHHILYMSAFTGELFILSICFNSLT